MSKIHQKTLLVTLFLRKFQLFVALEAIFENGVIQFKAEFPAVALVQKVRSKDNFPIS